MSTAIASISRLETLKENIAGIDERLGILHPRLRSLREEVAKLIEKENRHIRLFAEADHQEKQKIDQLLVEIVEQRASHERECKGLSIAIAELEETRNRIYPELQTLLEAEQRSERRMRIEELRRQHQRDQEAEQAADRALGEARATTTKSYFAWRSAKEQEALDAQAAALDKQKQVWAQHTGPNARTHVR